MRRNGHRLAGLLTYGDPIGHPRHFGLLAGEEGFVKLACMLGNRLAMMLGGILACRGSVVIILNHLLLQCLLIFTTVIFLVNHILLQLLLYPATLVLLFNHAFLTLFLGSIGTSLFSSAFDIRL